MTFLNEISALAEQHAGALLLLSLFSALSVLLMVSLGSRLLARLPADYFSNPARRKARSYLLAFPSWLRPLIPLLKNAIGLLLVLLGLAMLVLPGQGLLTLLAGVMLMNFPGKFRCELWLVKRKQVSASINWLRRRAGQPPLEIDN
jgi:hypothetical protein